ncbi:MAG: nitrilase [Campylobacterales bacterium]|nr:nitrilase [Campylobacterales bacterium]
MKVALIQSAPALHRRNLQAVLEIIEQYAHCDLLLFPELALSGYMLQDKLFEDAWALEELSMIAKASLHVEIVIGAAIRESGQIYNAALYFAQGRCVHIHRKMHLPNYGMFEEARYFSKGHEIEAFESRFGRAAMVVCEDLWRAQTLTRLSELKIDLLFLLVASPARDFSEEGLGIEKQWDALAKAAAILCGVYVLMANRVGFEDGVGFWGGSRVITPRGAVEYRLNNFEEGVLEATLGAHLHKVQKWMIKRDE